MKKMHCKLKFLTLFLLLGFVAYAQKTIPGSFKIINNSHPEKEAFYIASIEKADMEQYRLKDEPVTLNFTNGFVLELLSAKEVFINHGKIDPTSYKISKSNNYNSPVFTIQTDGWLTTEGYTNLLKREKTK